MNKRQRREFRKSAAWRNFRYKMKRASAALDAVTGEDLKRDWNLHHLDMDISRYDDLSDTGRFMCLNRDTHEVVHWLYEKYRKQGDALFEVLCIIIHRMEEYSGRD